MRRLSGRSTAAALCLAGCAWLAAAEGLAQPADALGAEEAIAIADSSWFEGIPEERLGPLSAGAVAALSELLADPSRAPAHAQAIELLGRAGGSGAAAALVDYAAGPLSGGRVSPHEHRARVALPHALGLLARADDLAFERLVALARRRDVGSWSTDRLTAERSARSFDEACATALALSGRPAARSELERMRREASATPGRTGRAAWLRHVDRAIEQHRQQAERRR